MTGFQKIRFEQMSKYDESRYEAEMTVYKNKLKNRSRIRNAGVPFSEKEDLLLAHNDAPNGHCRIKKRRKKSIFCLEEDMVLIDSAINDLLTGKLLKEAQINVRQNAELLQRSRTSVHNRWEAKIRSWILQYYAKTLNLQIKPMLANVLAENFESLETVDWASVLQYPEFSGHTARSLRIAFNHLEKNLCCQTKAKPNDYTLKQIAVFANEKYKPRKLFKRDEKRQNELIQYFEKMVKEKNITNFI